MSRTDAGNLTEIRAWVMTPMLMNPDEISTGAEPVYVFPWNWTDWTEAKRLVPERASKSAGSMGDASFRLMRQAINNNLPQAKDYRDRSFASPAIVPGAWICITAGPLAGVAGSGVPEVGSVLWWGFIDRVEGQQIAGTTELVGTVYALEIGHLLDRTIIEGWQQVGKRDSGGYGASDMYGVAPLGNVPTANLSGPIGGTVVGNMSVASGSSDKLGSSIYAFQNDMAQCSTDPVGSSNKFATRWRVLRHLLKFCLPASLLPGEWSWSYTGPAATGMPDPTASPISIPGYLNDTAVPEVIPIAKQTVKGMLDLLVPLSFGLGWHVSLSTDKKFQINLWTRNAKIGSDNDAFGLPVADPVNITVADHPVTNIQRMATSTDMPDAVVVEGAPCMFAGSFCFEDNTLGQGWDDTLQLVPYKTAAKDDAGYSSLTTQQQLDRNRAIRQSPAYSDVFTRFVLQPPDATTGILRVGSIGTGAGDVNACPLVSFDTSSGVTTISGSAQKTPYYPTMTLSRTVPWIVGIDTQGNDKRPTALRNWPQWMQPQLFYRDVTQPSGLQWIDLLAKGGTRPTPGVDVDDRGPALRVIYDKPERLGKGFIAFDGTNGQYDIQSESTQTEGANFFDWRKLVATVAYPSDQRVRVEFRRPKGQSLADGTRDEIDDRYVLRTITVTDDTLQCWTVIKGTILGLKTNGEPDRVTATNEGGGNYFVRNDFPRALRMAKRLAAWAFRKRQGFRIELMRPDSPPTWATLGSMIGKIKEAEESGITGSPAVASGHYVPVEAIEIIFGDSPRLIVTGEDPGLPALTAGSSSPAGGGPVSVSLGGTVPQAVQSVRSEVSELRAIAQQVPLVRDYTPQQLPNYKNLYIGTSNTLNTINGITYQGLGKAGSLTLTSVPSERPTSISQVVGNGLCAAYDLGVNGDYISGAPLVWVSSYRFLTIQDPANPSSTTLAVGTEFVFRSGCIVFSSTPYMVPIAGSPGQYAKVYVPNLAAF